MWAEGILNVVFIDLTGPEILYFTVPHRFPWTAHSAHGVLMESVWNAHGVCGMLMDSMSTLICLVRFTL
jgi:hypothetical protein